MSSFTFFQPGKESKKEIEKEKSQKKEEDSEIKSDRVEAARDEHDDSSVEISSQGKHSARFCQK